nr:IclR family transcriptional regulator C-terminal domain-containing protein [Microbacterium aurum]
MTSVVGGRNPAFCTAVGKMLLSEAAGSIEELSRIVAATPLVAHTPQTIVSVEALWDDLQRTRERGYAIDDQENEQGVNCVAVPLRSGTHPETAGAVSVSALAFRTPLPELIARIDEVRAIVESRGATR